MSDMVYKRIDFDNNLDLGCISFQNQAETVMFRELRVCQCVCVLKEVTEPPGHFSNVSKETSPIGGGYRSFKLTTKLPCTNWST